MTEAGIMLTSLMEKKVLNVELKVDPPLQTGHNGMGHMCDVKCAQWGKS